MARVPTSPGVNSRPAPRTAQSNGGRQTLFGGLQGKSAQNNARAISNQRVAASERTRMTALYQELKFRSLEMVHDYIEATGVEIADIGAAELRQEVSRSISIAISGVGAALNASERDSLIDDVYNELTGLGPLESLLNDESIDDIIVHRFDRIYVERNAKLELANIRFRDNDHLMTIIHRIVSPLGRRVDESAPFVDARLPDGSRVNIAVPPVMIDGPTVSIRKFKRVPLSASDLVRAEALTSPMMNYLARCVRSRLNIVISGGTGAGKTTLLNVLSGFISESERLVTIEDAAELQLRQPHVARMETRPAGPEGARAITARELLFNSLRMRPDRVILGEVRGGEAVEMLQAMTIGHEGSMGTIHANTPKDALLRMELLLGFGGLKVDVLTMRRLISSAVNIIVQVQKTHGGVRRIVHIAEVQGLEGETVLLHDRYIYTPGTNGARQGQFVEVTPRSVFEPRLVNAEEVALVAPTWEGQGGGI